LHQLRLRYIFVFHNGKGASLFLVRQQGVSGEDTFIWHIPKLVKTRHFF